MQSKEFIARRAAQELQNGNVVNLGIGIPGMVADYVPAGIEITLHAENGLVGIAGRQGATDPEIENASGHMVIPAVGAATMDSAFSFALTRGGHIDVCILGALQVDRQGNLANHLVPGKIVPGMGGAMDVVAGAKKVIIAMEHCAKDGSPKILNRCSLPLTALQVVDLLVTELAVFTITQTGLLLTEHASGVTVEEIKSKTQATFTVSPQLQKIQV